MVKVSMIWFINNENSLRRRRKREGKR